MVNPELRIDDIAQCEEPLNGSLCAQRDLKRAAVVSCLDGQGGVLSERQGAADVRFRSRPPGLPG